MRSSEYTLANRINGTRLIEGAYAQDEALTNVVIPEGVTDIGEVAFYGCPNLAEVQFPSTLKTIREEAFGESGLTKVLLPEGVEVIGEKAFFCCNELSYIEVPGKQTEILVDAFIGCEKLLEGYIARGYAKNCIPPEELLYTLLWCSCPEKHSPETSKRAMRFICEQESLIMERILKFQNTAALSGIARYKLLKQENIPYYMNLANEKKLSELVALLLTAVDHTTSEEDEFEL